MTNTNPFDRTGMTTVRITPAQVDDVLRRVNNAFPKAEEHVAKQGTGTSTPIASQNGIVVAISAVLPTVINAIQPIIAARKITIATATAAITAISSAVAALAPQIKGADARAVVLGTFDYVWDTYLVGVLPVWIKPFAGVIKNAAVQGLEIAYQSVVKKRG